MKTVFFSLLALVAVPTACLADEPAEQFREHEIAVGKAAVDFEAGFEKFDAIDPKGAVGAEITTISYVVKGGAAERPIIFGFNGGPGAESIYLNIGVLGPWRLDLPSDPKAPIAAKTPLVVNPDTPLDAADIVLIDPVGTGFSRLIDPTASQYFYSVGGDAKAIADTIRAWLRRHGRQGAPVYVLGESYGATRAVQVGRNLARGDQAVNLQGLVLVSQSLPIVDTVQRRSNIVGTVAGMPTIAATAWYHKVAGKGRSLDAFVEEASAFANDVWLPALYAGSKLNERERRKVASGLSGFTGVSEAWLLAHDLYMSKEDYRRLALKAKGEILGLYDTRFTGMGPQSPDSALIASFGAGRTAYWMQAFGTDISAPEFERSLNGSLGQSWIYLRQPFAPTAGSTYSQIDYVADLMDLMDHSPELRVMVAGGWFDTAASVGADHYLLSRPGLPIDRITARSYIGGHMFYTDPDSRKAFTHSIRDFVSGAGQ